ncbi:hypothetical protein HanIR_Chr03g0135251 [Helianthus annuus]|nr:hypothetical protein HanIR_Chr03g0135251 [Helianthus annuus]
MNFLCSVSKDCRLVVHLISCTLFVLIGDGRMARRDHTAIHKGSIVVSHCTSQEASIGCRYYCTAAIKRIQQI